MGGDDANADAARPQWHSTTTEGQNLIPTASLTDLTIEVADYAPYDEDHSGLLLSHEVHPPPWTATEEAAIRWTRGRLALLAVRLLPAMNWQIHHHRCHNAGGVVYAPAGQQPTWGRRDDTADTFETVTQHSIRHSVCELNVWAPPFPVEDETRPTQLELTIPTTATKAWRARLDDALAVLLDPESL